jgi:drug/metabolite transporter (DMT)-like permease
MSSLKQQIFSFIGITGIYIGIIALAFNPQLILQNVVAIGVVLVVFVLSTLITSTGKIHNPEANAQKFLLGTTVQMLASMFFLLITKFTDKEHFKSMCIHYLILFFAFLIIQVFFLLKRVRQAN